MMRPVVLVVATMLPLSAAIWPLPKAYTHGNSDLCLRQNTTFTYTNASNMPLTYNPNICNSTSDKNNVTTVIITAIQRFYDSVSSQAFIPWRFYPRGTNFEPNCNGNTTWIQAIHLVQNGTNHSGGIWELSEAYVLDMLENGTVSITADSAVGLAHGLTSFSQLFFKSTDGQLYTRLAPVHISDEPKFQHRGLNLDISRTYYPVADILRTLDAMSFNKLNRLHLHITDAQSWPLEIPSLPELSAKGAYPPGLVYTPANVEQIQSYGALRGIEVYLEIDMPGHTSSIFLSYPDLITAYNQQPDWQTYSAEPPSGSLRLNNTGVHDLLDTLWKDLLPRVAPFTNLFHTGGDEVNYNTYLLDPNVATNSSAVIKPLLQTFIDEAHAHVSSYHLNQIVWEEVLLMYNVSLPGDVIIQTWQSDAAVLESVQRGHRTLAGNYEFWYLDCGKGQWIDFAPGPASKGYWPYLDYCDPRKNWRLIYSYDPLRGVPENLQHLVIGGEAHMWSEQTDPVNLDVSLWPRLSAVGEVLWRGQPQGGMNLSQTEASPRLADMRERLVGLGVRAEPVQMPFCTMYAGDCVISQPP